MTEEEARDRSLAIAGPHFVRIEHFATMLIAENARQNLISPASTAQLWSRHIYDSLQLVRFVRDSDRSWADIGSGPGLPGLILALLDRWQVTLIEPRKRRVDFLRTACDALGLDNCHVLPSAAETVADFADIISARAVATSDALFTMSTRMRHAGTRYVLPKGRSASSDIASAALRWHGVFHVEPSETDPEAGIVIADGVRPR